MLSLSLNVEEYGRLEFLVILSQGLGVLDESQLRRIAI